MKYCTKCKRRGKANESSCAQCGNPFRQLGVGRSQRNIADASTQENAATRSDRGQRVETKFDLDGMQHRVAKSADRVKWLARVAGLMLALFLAMLLYLRYDYVMQYAEVANVSVQRSSRQPDSVLVVYQPMTSGRIEFVRTSPNRVEKLVDHAPLQETGTAPRRFRWSDAEWNSVTVEVRYRKGWSIVTETAVIGVIKKGNQRFQDTKPPFQLASHDR